MSMAHSLELRVPMLDNRIVDLMVTAPWQDKFLPGVCGKLALRKAMKDILPEESLRKPKWGFSVDVSSWYKGELGELVRQIVPTSDIIERYFSKKAVGRLIDRPSTPENRRYQVLLVADCWDSISGTRFSSTAITLKKCDSRSTLWCLRCP